MNLTIICNSSIPPNFEGNTTKTYNFLFCAKYSFDDEVQCRQWLLLPHEYCENKVQNNRPRTINLKLNWVAAVIKQLLLVIPVFFNFNVSEFWYYNRTRNVYWLNLHILCKTGSLLGKIKSDQMLRNLVLSLTLILVSLA